MFFDRGVESIIRRAQIFDTSGNLLESIDHYNALYAITELCTGEPDVRKGRGRFTMECMTINDYDRGSAVWPEPNPQTVTLGEVWQNQPRVLEVTFNLISGVFGGTCEKYWPLKAINGLVIELQLENVTEALSYRFIPIQNEDVEALPTLVVGILIIT